MLTKLTGKSRESFLRKQHARYLVIVKGYEQKQAAKEVNVSEKTIGAWARAGRWKDQRDAKENPLKEPSINWFMFYVLINAPHLHKRINKLWDAYTDSYKINNDDMGSKQ